MEMNLETLQELSMISTRDLEIAPFESKTSPNFSTFRNWLIHVIERMIEQDFGKLVNLLYKIDVSEIKAKEAFAATENPAARLADLIIERELKKVETRKKYRAR
jgi:hypothetical protein